jgi:hypothetical protein
VIFARSQVTEGSQQNLTFRARVSLSFKQDCGLWSPALSQQKTRSTTGAERAQRFSSTSVERRDGF